MRATLGNCGVMVWGSAAGQNNDGVTRMRVLRACAGNAAGAPFRVGYVMPVFLVDLFMKIKPGS